MACSPKVKKKQEYYSFFGKAQTHSRRLAHFFFFFKGLQKRKY